VEDMEFLTLPLSVGSGGLRHVQIPSKILRKEVIKLYAALRRGGNDLK